MKTTKETTNVHTYAGDTLRVDIARTQDGWCSLGWTDPGTDEVGQASIGVPLAALPALVNALLRLCTHAQLGEVVVPRRAGEWERCGDESRRYGGHDGDDVVGLAQLMPSGVWVPRWRCVDERMQGMSGLPTRAEAEAAVDERLRADGVVLP